MRLKKAIKRNLLQFDSINYYQTGRDLINNTDFISGNEKTQEEYRKTPNRTKVINFLIEFLNRDVTYLEIGVRNPSHNFNLINAKTKYSVDPGVEFKENPVDFVMTSDEFFNQLQEGKVLSPDCKFDVIFVDGLHLAEQVDRDITNALQHLQEDGFVVLHDCNPPTEWHARESYWFPYTPAQGFWNGTTWKAFLKWRQNPEVFSCCVDCDWGVGILSKTHKIGNSISLQNPFFEFSVLNNDRKKLLNLISFEHLNQSLAER